MKIAPSDSQTHRRTRRREPVILFSISGQMFAMNANAIHEIRSAEGLAAAATGISSSAVTKVRHLLRRGNMIFFVVSGCEHFALPPSRAEHVVILRNSRIALLVESIDRMDGMSVLLALPAGFSGPERTWYRGVTVVSGNIVPVINPSGFLSELELATLDAITAEAETKALESDEAQDHAAQEHAQ